MSTLYDHRGKAISPSRLTREQAIGSIGSVRSPYEELIAPGLTPRRLASLIKRATQGDHADYLQLADEMEKRDLNYFAALQTRKLAVQQLERTVEASSNAGEDVKVSDAVRSWLFKPEFGRALLQVLDATSKGFSVTEIIWAKSEEIWKPVDFKFRPQRWFFFEYERAEELRLHDGSVEGEKLEPFKYIVHIPHVFSGSPIAGGLARVVATYHVLKGYALKNWAAFAEVFGMPLRIGKYDQGASDQDKQELKRAVRMIGSDAAATIPSTMSIEFLRAAGSGFSGSDEFFMIFANWLDRQVNKAVLGSNFTDEDGGSFAKAVALNELRKDLRNSDAWQCADSVQGMLVRPFVDLNFGPRRRDDEYPLVNFDTSESENLESLAKALIPFVKMGLPVSVASMLEKFGLEMPDGSEPILRAPEPTTSAERDGENEDAEDTEENASAAEMRALVARIARVAEGTTNMRRFRQELREMVSFGAR